MHSSYLEPGESLQTFARVRFASGVAPLVAERMSFRDSGRNDIEADLPGWPPGPRFEPHTPKEQRSSGWWHKVEAAVPLLVNALSSTTGPGTNLKLPAGVESGPEEPENEVGDFPVMWADEGTVARTVPFALDPRRCPDGQDVHLAVTDRRMVFVARDRGSGEVTAVLWQLPLEEVRETRRMRFSEQRKDVRVVFRDGSWIRLSPWAQQESWKIVPLLVREARRVPRDELNDAQRAYLDRRAAQWKYPDAMEWTFTLLGDGGVLSESGVPDRRGDWRETHINIITPEGQRTGPERYGW